MGKLHQRSPTYDALPFHVVRASSFLSATIVTSALVHFCVQLNKDGFKIPWTFLGVLAASGLNVIVLLTTSVFYCCGKLSPLFNFILNIPVLVIWVAGLSLLSWNMSGVLVRSCSIGNWGNNDGIKVCNIYKTLYAFIIIAILSHTAQVVLDVRARRKQNRLGKYNKMQESADIKMEPVHGFGSSSVHDNPYPHEQMRDDIPGWRPGASSDTNLIGRDRNGSGTSIPLQYSSNGQTGMNASQSYADSRETVRMDQFGFADRSHNTNYNPADNYYQDFNRRY